MEPHLLIALSPHGFGHLAQTAPVLAALRLRVPGLRVTVETALPAAMVEPRLPGPYTYHAHDTDFGMVMDSALDVAVEKSARAYRAVHAQWETNVQAEARRLQAARPDLVLADIPYLVLAAAERAGVPAIAMCSLNWADIYQHYCGHYPEAAEIHAQILAAYRSAECFLQPSPHMPMTDLSNRRAIGPIARTGHNRRGELRQRLGLAADDRLVVVAAGGIDLPLPVGEWPVVPGIRWVISARWAVERADIVTIESLQLPFIDLMCSCDALVGKPGYGTFVEAACNNVPVLYVRRPDWPEQEYLTAWLTAHGHCLEIERAQLLRGDLADPLKTLLGAPRRAPVSPTGVMQAADYIASVLND